MKEHTANPVVWFPMLPQKKRLPTIARSHADAAGGGEFATERPPSGTLRPATRQERGAHGAVQ